MAWLLIATPRTRTWQIALDLMRLMPRHRHLSLVMNAT
jgi:hypothetical protein